MNQCQPDDTKYCKNKQTNKIFNLSYKADIENDLIFEKCVYQILQLYCMTNFILLSF